MKRTQDINSTLILSSDWQWQIHSVDWGPHSVPSTLQTPPYVTLTISRCRSYLISPRLTAVETDAAEADQPVPGSPEYVTEPGLLARAAWGQAWILKSLLCCLWKGFPAGKPARLHSLGCGNSSCFLLLSAELVCCYKAAWFPLLTPSLEGVSPSEFP